MTQEINEDRFSFLFDLASGNIRDANPGLTSQEAEELRQIQALLEVIDKSWKAAPSELDQVRARFLEKLSIGEPNHPWVTDSTVRTLGELVRITGDDAPPFPDEVYESLVRDATPVVDLLDLSRRTSIIGQVALSARVPQDFIGEFMLWVNRNMSALFPLPGSTQPRYVFTRKQGGNRGSR